MHHLTNIKDIEQAIADNRLCLFYIKAPDCGVCNVMLDKVEIVADGFSSLCSFYTDIVEEPLIASHFLDCQSFPGLFRANSIAVDGWKGSLSWLSVH